jgi:hypothetical protein
MGDEESQTRDSKAQADSDSWPYDPYWVEIDRPLERLRLAAQAERAPQVNSAPDAADRT